MFKLLSIAAICTLAAAPLAPVWAASCTSLNIKGFSEGDVVYKDKSSRRWTEVEKVARVANLADELQGTTRFYYVAKGKPYERGILIIKTARAPKPSESDSANTSGAIKSVRLERKRYPGGIGSGCRVESRPKIDRNVSGKTYDGYHDYGFNKGEGLQLIKQFHIGYVRRDGECDITDNPYNAGWALFGIRVPSNRSQFSFDKTVVKHRMYYKTAGWLPVAYAAHNLYDRHVIMEPYTISDDKTACVPFNLKVRPDSILRIVDLDAREMRGNRRPESER